MTIELIIDTREHHLIQEMKNKHNGVEISIQQLDLGDIIFKENDEDILVIERKTVSDLKASICDGRNREQKARLMSSGMNVSRIMYVIEGDLDMPLDSKKHGLPISTLLGSLVNTQLRDGIKVYKTSSLKETANYIHKLFTKLTKDGDKYFKNESGISDQQYSATLKKKKKANMTPNIWFITQLSLIPQITEKVAAVVLGKYPTISHLIKEYEITPEHLREKLLADFTFTTKTGKSRKIGEKVSSRVYHFFYGIENESRQ